MPCYQPHRITRGPTGLNWRPRLDDLDGSERWVNIPCGSCVGCGANLGRDWSVRIYHDVLFHTRNWRDPDTKVQATIPHACVVTLTYDEEHVPEHLDHRDFQLFMKKLRKKFGADIRYFMAGEYGGKSGRPHFHAILIGLDFDDQYEITLPGGNEQRMSHDLDALWGKGIATVDGFSFPGAMYVAGYVGKKMGTPKDLARIREVVDENGVVSYVDPHPEYRKMSRGRGDRVDQETGEVIPGSRGLGHDWCLENLHRIYPDDVIRIGGYVFKPPTYYDNILKKHDRHLHQEVLLNRLEGQAETAEEWSPERAEAAEAVYLSGLAVRRDQL